MEEQTSCANCSCDLPHNLYCKLNHVCQYFIGTKGERVCQKCYDEIHRYSVYGEGGKGWTYDNFYIVEQKYPKIYERGFYQRPDIRKRLGLK